MTPNPFCRFAGSLRQIGKTTFRTPRQRGAGIRFAVFPVTLQGGNWEKNGKTEFAPLTRPSAFGFFGWLTAKRQNERHRMKTEDDELWIDVPETGARVQASNRGRLRVVGKKTGRGRRVILCHVNEERRLVCDYKTGLLGWYVFFDGKNRIMKGQLVPGASIGYHIHDLSCELLLITEGHGTVIYDDERYTISAGEVHFCPKGHSHSVVNDSDAPLKFYAFVPEQL